MHEKNNMKKIIHRADSRINNDFGWLRISASFRDDAEPQRKNFHTLLILDDALMIPSGRGFKLHPHDNMEIISWILSGVDEHNDSRNGVTLLGRDEVQLMSAGTGIEHAENNHSETEAVHMFQIWIAPKMKDIEPRYQVKSLHDVNRVDQLVTFISPDGRDNSLTINQDAFLSVITLSESSSFTYEMKKSGNALYIFLLYGDIDVEDISLKHRDAIGLEDMDSVKVQARHKSDILFIEVP